MAPFDLVAGKRTWLSALEEAEEFVRTRPDDELGCLYYAVAREAFVMPASPTDLASKGGECTLILAPRAECYPNLPSPRSDDHPEGEDGRSVPRPFLYYVREQGQLRRVPVLLPRVNPRLGQTDCRRGDNVC